LGVSALLLMSLSGAQWWILQSVAWSGMIVSYSAESGFLRGVERTFDGEHPCPMCKAIQQARESESKPADALAPIQKPADLLGLAPETSIFLQRASFLPPSDITPEADQLNSRPPVPPPRTLPA